MSKLNELQELGKECARNGQSVESLLRQLVPTLAEAEHLNAAMAAYIAELREQLLAEAQNDALTSLPNRAAFARHFEIECARAIRYERVLTLALLDLNGFKQINDTRGHLAGDESLRQFARLLTAALRKSDMAFRFGGDEFVVLFPETTASAAHGVMQRLADCLTAEQCSYSFSFGSATLPDDGTDTTALIACADKRLYEQKRFQARQHTRQPLTHTA